MHAGCGEGPMPLFQPCMRLAGHAEPPWRLGRPRAKQVAATVAVRGGGLGTFLDPQKLARERFGTGVLAGVAVAEVEDAAPRPIVMGRHLIELGLTPGPHFGRILEACYEAQIEGQFFTLEEGIELAKRLIEHENLK